jgi:hypothetical protein
VGLSNRLGLTFRPVETACEPRTPVRYIHASLEGNWLIDITIAPGIRRATMNPP